MKDEGRRTTADDPIYPSFFILINLMVVAERLPVPLISEVAEDVRTD